MKYIINKQSLGEDKFICTANFEPQELKEIIFDKYNNGYKHEYILRMFFTQDEINNACLHEGFDITLEKQYFSNSFGHVLNLPKYFWYLQFWGDNGFLELQFKFNDSRIKTISDLEKRARVHSA